jgi:hypothetical protein
MFVYYRYNKCFNKHTGRWSAVPVKVAKGYPHIPLLKERAMNLRLADPDPLNSDPEPVNSDPLHRHKELELTDAKRVLKHPAPMSLPQSDQYVVKKFRFV